MEVRHRVVNGKNVVDAFVERAEFDAYDAEHRKCVASLRRSMPGFARADAPRPPRPVEDDDVGVKWSSLYRNPYYWPPMCTDWGAAKSPKPSPGELEARARWAAREQAERDRQRESRARRCEALDGTGAPWREP